MNSKAVRKASCLAKAWCDCAAFALRRFSSVALAFMASMAIFSPSALAGNPTVSINLPEGRAGEVYDVNFAEGSVIDLDGATWDTVNFYNLPNGIKQYKSGEHDDHLYGKPVEWGTFQVRVVLNLNDNAGTVESMADLVIERPPTLEVCVASDPDYEEYCPPEVDLGSVPDGFVGEEYDFVYGGESGIAWSGGVWNKMNITGLPDGVLQYKSGEHDDHVYGIPKAAGEYLVTFTADNGFPTATKIVTIGQGDAKDVKVVGRGGTVTGAGCRIAGSTMTLKATPAEGYVFSGWYSDSSGDTPFEGTTDHQSMVLGFTMPDEDSQIYPKFIATDRDWASIGCSIEDEYETKQPISPIAVNAEGGSLPTVKVTGLPAGLKYTDKLVTAKVTTGTGKAKVTTLVTNALPHTIYGTPTKSGIYTATVTATTVGKATATKVLTFIVINRAAGERVLKTCCDSTMGKITGAGIYKVGAKVTLKATANAAKKATKTAPAQTATAFAGWYSDEWCSSPLSGAVDYRTPTFAYTIPDEDTTVYARFVDAVDDEYPELLVDGSVITDDAYETQFYTEGALTLALEADSCSLPKIAVSGLPSGLKFTTKQVLNKDKSVLAEANTIYGTAKKPGIYVVTTKLTNATVKKPIEGKFAIIVDNLKGANGVITCEDADGNSIPLNNDRGCWYEISAGVSRLYMPNRITSSAGAVKVTGLPTGLKYNAKTGAITGVPTKPGAYTVYVTVGKLVSTFNVVVEELPYWAVGQFEGYGNHEDSPFDGEDFLVSVTVSAAGKISGKFIMDNCGEGANPTATFSVASFADSEGDDYYCDVAVKFAMKGRSDEIRNCRLTFYKDDDGTPLLRCSEDDPFELEVGQCVMKSEFAQNFKFPKAGISDSYTHVIEGDPETEGTSTIKITVDARGAVKAEGVDTGTDCGKRFRDTYKSSCNLVALGQDSETVDALAAFKCSDGSVWWINYTITDTDEDGVFDSLEITDTVVFWEWD